AGGDAVDVDGGDDQRDRDDLDRRLEQRRQRHADERGGDQLGEGRRQAVQPDHDQQRGGHHRRGRERGDDARGQDRERQQLAGAGSIEGDRDQREPGGLDPDRDRREPRRDDVDDGERRRRQARPAQYGGRFSYHSPSTLNAVQKLCLASASFSERSMSG